MYYQLRDQRLLDFANWTSTNYLTVQISYAAFTGIGVQVIKKKLMILVESGLAQLTTGNSNPR